MFPLIPLAISAGTSLLGKLLGNKESARTSTSTPTVAPEYKTLSDLLRGRAEERLRSTMDMSGYTANGISGINQAFQGINQASNADLTSRGLATSPVAATVGQNLNMARGSNIAQFLNTIPQLQRQFENQDFDAASGLVSRNTGTTNVGAGSAAGAGLDDLSGWLGYIFRQRQLGG